MSTGRLLLLFVLLLTLCALVVLVLAAVRGWVLGDVGALLQMFVAFVVGWVVKSPLWQGGAAKVLP